MGQQLQRLRNYLSEDEENDKYVLETVVCETKTQLLSGRFIEINPKSISNGVQLPTPELIFLINADLNSLSFKTPRKATITNNLINKHLEAAWMKADNEIRNREKELHHCIEFFGRRGVIATMTYSLDNPPVYSDFNEAFRIICQNKEKDIYLYDKDKYIRAAKKFIAYLPLVRHLSEMQWLDSFLPENIFLYRGCSTQIRANVGDVMTICNYTSTSILKENAVMFAGSKGALLKFTGMLSGIPISQMSFFPREEEVLLFPFQTFEFIKIDNSKPILEITLLSRTKKAIEIFKKLNQYFPFHMDTLEKCYYIINETIFFDERQNSVYCFNSADLRKFGYKPPKIEHNTKLPTCHILVISQINHNQLEQLSANKFINFFVLIPNIQTLIDCLHNNKSVYMKSFLAQTDLYETITGVFKTGHIEIEKVPDDEVKQLIKICKNTDENATSFVLGDVIDLSFWYQYITKGFSKQTQTLMNVCITQKDWSTNRFLNDKYSKYTKNYQNIIREEFENIINFE